VFIDEAYSEFATAKDYPNLIPLLEKFPNLMLNRTFSKIYGLAGVRVGYAFSSREVIKALWKVKPPFDVNLAAQAAAEAALSDDDHIRKTLDMNNAGNVQLTEAFTKLGYKVLPTQANFLCIRIGEKCAELVKFLEQNGMIIRYLKSFGMPEWVRVTIGQPKENQLLIDLVTKWTNA
jgi:histidinol-phosphate aminotransferase